MGSVSARDIIQAAFEELQVYAPGETAFDADVARGLATLNAMIDSWSNESLSCYAILEQTATLQVGVNSYTIGPGGDFDMVRPLRLIDGPGAAYIQDDTGNNYPLQVVPRDQWNLIGLRTINSNIPNVLFYDPQYPLGIMNFFPIPNISYSAFWDSYLQLTEFTSLSTALNLPLGYEEAFKRNLSLYLKPFYPNAVLDPLTVELASKAKGNIKRTNIRALVAEYDQEIVAKGNYSYNIYSDRGA